MKQQATTETTLPTPDADNWIYIKGARGNNLKNIDLNIPKNQVNSPNKAFMAMCFKSPT